MKKLLAVLSASAILVTSAVFSAGATAGDDLYKDKFNERYSQEALIHSKPDYKELYHHAKITETGLVNDWVLVYGDTHYGEPMCTYAVFGDRVVAKSGWGIPFATNYGIYDIAKDEFIDLCKVWNSSDYEDLQRVCAECKIGQPIGDVNNDNVLDIEDVTNIQKSLATTGIEAKRYIVPSDAYDFRVSHALTTPLNSMADINKDGKTDIDDATEIQKRIAFISVD